MSYEYSDKLNLVARERYGAKLQAAGLESCPYKLEAGCWKNDPTKWPDVQYPDIYSYLVETPGVFTKEAMKSYKSLEAHNYFVSGWVQQVFYTTTTSGLVLLKADVKPSQRLNNEPHHPWVVVKKDGSVVAAHCNCMAG
ncbi:uncharacterized protein LOC117118188 [Anneissia japonica]|uniref:uncharacterized protein LOC117118188 n=1 Tax=Anneissia japonica TaxID=1529436 RepID=UPI0014257133|nr:uncharacterized protein LOC117118188 [Anneissia japonica]